MSDASSAPIRKSVSLPAGIWKQVEDYRFANRVQTESEAIRRLIELGLSAASIGRGPKSKAAAEDS